MVPGKPKTPGINLVNLVGPDAAKHAAALAPFLRDIQGQNDMLQKLAAQALPDLQAINSAKVLHSLVTEQQEREKRDLLVSNSVFQASARQAAEVRERENEKLELLRRSAVASETAIYEAHRREQAAIADAKKAYAIAVVGVLVGVVGLALAAWPFIVTRLEAL